MRVDDAVMAEAIAGGELAGAIWLTDAHGLLRCARVDPPAISWPAP